MRRFLPVLILVGLVACVDRSQAPVVPSALTIGTIHPVFVATTRDPDENGILGRERTQDLQFLQVDVSVPPQHQSGKISSSPVNPDPNRDFTIAARQDFTSESEFTRRLRAHIRAKPANDREVVLYVHGYNNSFSDGVFRAAQLMHDLDLPGTAVHFSWPSAANPLGYTYDRDSMLFSRDGLEETLRQVRAAGPSQIVLVGHSLGTMLVMETLRQIEIADAGWSSRALGGVILISPDIDVDLFKTQAGRIAALPQPFAIFTSKNDKALRLSARLNGSTARLGGLTDPAELAEFPVVLVDISQFTGSTSVGHFAVGTSPALIALLSNSAELDRAFQRDRAGTSGLLPGTVLTVQNATQLILSPGLVMQKKRLPTGG